MSSLFSYNPLTNCITINNHIWSQGGLQGGLQGWCRKNIIKTISLKNIHYFESLPVPRKLKLFICDLKVSDFLIQADRIGPDSHLQRSYPAVCLLNNTPVILNILQTGETVNKKDLRYITSFEEKGQTVVIEEQTKTLSNVIEKCKKDGQTLREEFIWRLLLDITMFMIQTKMPITTTLGCQHIFFLGEDEMFIEIRESMERNHVTKFEAKTAIYDAPEIISCNTPDTRAHSWTIGCILHEMLALEPAYHDESGTNPFQVYVNISNGFIPDEPRNGSEDLKDLLRKCLIHNKQKRISLKEIYMIVKHHISSTATK